MADGRRDTDIRDGKVDGHDNDEQFKQEEEDEVLKMANTPGFFKKILDSICPTVFGHQEIKTAVLLTLLGGVEKPAHEGLIYSRGNINVCIVGDPSCAKSQFLKDAVGLLPRSVYFSGETSSAAGLTATVANKPETGGLCIEVAIHEALKQQTISITKSGVQAPLNAGTSILAAANPNIGGYDKSKPLKDNLSLIPATRWRFDLVYVMIDEPDENTEDAHAPEFTVAQLKRYIAYAKSLKPKLSSEARKALVESRVALLRGDTAPGSTAAYRMTVRQIEALIRLSEALARGHLEKMVLAAHVHMAANLLKTSIISVESSEIDLSFLQGEDGGDVKGVRDPNAAAPDTSADAGTAENNAGDHGTKNELKEEGAITEEHFQRVSQALVMHLRQHAERVMRNGGGVAGMKQRDLIAWYVRQQNARKAYSCREEVGEEIKCIKAIIERLIRSEGCLLVIDDGTTASPTEGGEASTSPSQDRLLALAPKSE